MSGDKRQTVVVAGASGFVGRGLPEMLAESYELIGLSRNPRRARQKPGGTEYRWRRSDLFSRIDTRRSLAGADLAIYLVHSLEPTARLTQGRVGDLDLICADNFARAARHHDIDHIVYLSAMVPARGQCSHFLASRNEVAKTLAGYGTPVTTLRTSMVLGPGGSGLEIIAKLVERLPVMVLPRWVDEPFWPIARCDLVELIQEVLLHPGFAGKPHDVGGREPTTFRGLLELVGELTGARSRLISTPVNAPELSTRWIELWTGYPRPWIRALVESLMGGAPVERGFQNSVTAPETPLRCAVEDALEIRRSHRRELVRVKADDDASLIRTEEPNEVRAVHRLGIPDGWDVQRLAEEYFRWLGWYFRPMLDVVYADTRLIISLRPVGFPLLVMEHDAEVSTGARQLFWLRSGLLVDPHEPGRLEFRRVLGGRSALAVIHEFRPRLPWMIYVGTQARVHHFVMAAFDRHLRRIVSNQ